MSARTGMWLTFTALVLGASAAGAADAAPDEEFLEFLGSIDSEDEDWAEFLTGTGIAQDAATPPVSTGPEVEEDEHE